MSTDPFDGVLRPISGEGQEISQTTFVELISAKRELISPAVRPSTPSVQNSLNRVAFGRTCAGTTTDPSTAPSTIIATPQQTNTLSYSAQTTPQAAPQAAAVPYHEKIAGLAAAKSSVDIRSMVFNSLVDGVCPEMPSDPCLDAPCPVDLVIALNNSRVFLSCWDQVKAGVEDFIRLMATEVNENMRIGIVTFHDGIVRQRYLWYTHVSGHTEYQCIDALAGGITTVRHLSLPPHHYSDIEDWSAFTVKRVCEGFIGDWRESTKMILLVTGTPNADYTGTTATEAAIIARDCGVLVNYCLVPAIELFTPPGDPAITATMVAEGNAYQTYTGGKFVHVNANGTGIGEAYDSWIDMQCTTDADPCTVAPGDVCPVDLAIVLDDTGSMGSAIAAVKDGIAGVLGILQDAIGLNIRLSLITFKDEITVRYEFGADCGADALAAFELALADVRASGGGNIAEWSAAAAKYSADGNAGAWRTGTDIVKAMLIITDAVNNTSSGVTHTQAASAAASAGIRVAYAATPSNPLMLAEGETYADVTNGIFVQTNSDGEGLPELLTTWIYGLCSSSLPARECDGGTDHIINGTFDANISGWDIYTAPVSWASSRQAMFIVNREGVGGEARQTISGLIPGDRLVLSASIATAQVGGISYGVLGIRTDTADLEDGGTIRIQMSVDIVSTEQTIFFRSDDVGGGFFYLDNVVACVYKVDDCGPGSRNLVINGGFTEGVEYWTDDNGTDLPITDSKVWDSSVQAIIANVSEYNEVRTTILVEEGKTFTLSFNVLSHEPSAIPDVSIEYGILNDVNTVIVEDSRTAAELGELPQTLTLSFTAPPSGIAKIFFKTGAIGGVTKISSVLVCDQAGICEPGYSLLSFDDFAENKGGWGGGLLDEERLLVYTSPGGGFPAAAQIYEDLEPGSIVSVTMSLVSPADSWGKIQMYSGDVVDQLPIGPDLGQYTLESIVQSTGRMGVQIGINAGGNNHVYVDDVLVCVKTPVKCDGSITSTKAFIEWVGVPRRPFNVFNAMVRYTTRSTTDHTDKTDYNYLPTTEGHIGHDTCDFWKQQGRNGVAQNDILRNGIGEETLPSIDDGDFVSVATKINWEWSIPFGGTYGQDNLIISIPDPPPDVLVESMTIFLLTQYCQPSGDDTTPVDPPPLSCGTDPAPSVNVSIAYVNDLGLNREFTANKVINELWWQDVDFEQNLPATWDNHSALGNGIKGDIARWDAFTFALDTVDGKGLDQCTDPIDFDEEATKGELTFSKFQLSGEGKFVDACDAVVTVEFEDDYTQYVYLVRPTGGRLGGWFFLTITAPGAVGSAESGTSAGIYADTTAEQMASAINSMPLWVGHIEPVSVEDVNDGADPNIFARFKVTFTGVGEVEPMVPDFETSLICDPLILTPVPEGPYDYPLPVGGDDDLSCQSGPLLTRPGVDDGTPVAETCCDQDTITADANQSNRFCMERDLFDPNRLGCCGGETTIRDLAVRKGLNPLEYQPYLRDWETNTLSDATYSQAIKLGQSIILVENELDTESGRDYVLRHLSDHREILPSRMYWPQGDSNVV